MKTLQKTDLFALGRGSAAYKVAFEDINQVVSVGATPPTAPVKGALWFNVDKGVTYTYDGTYWIG